jgi:hypothetical protein
MERNKWTKEAILEIAKQYPNVKAWKLGNMPSYQAAQRYKILKEARSFLSNELHRKWDYKSLKKESTKYQSKIEWIDKDHASYQSAYDLGILDELTQNMKGRRKRTKEEVFNTASLFKSVKEWMEAHPKDVFAARDYGWYEEATKHMERMGGKSIEELRVLEWVQQFCPSAHKLKIEGKEMDIYIPELKLGIEYNGLFWHSDYFYEDELKHLCKHKHINKTTFFKEKGIDIVHIWSSEWLNRKEQVKNFLHSKLGVGRRIGARKCEFRSMDLKEAYVFCNANHIQGAKTGSSLALGCYYDNELVGVATFGNHHRGKAEIVLNRLCYKFGYNIMGALSKFSITAARHYKSNIFTWVHRTLSTGESYVKAGWEILEVSKPDYFYVYGLNKVISKQSRMKAVVNTPEGMTEAEHAKLDKLNRVWDCGKIKLMYRYV